MAIEFPTTAPLLRQLRRGLRQVAGLPVAAALKRDPQLCDPSWYRAQYGIAVNSPHDVFTHYVKHGWRLGYDPNPLFETNWYVAQQRKLLRKTPLDPLTHFVAIGRKLALDPNPFFDTRHYLGQLAGEEVGPLGPLKHYLATGAAQDLSPVAWFDSRWYRQAHRAGDERALLPLAHYLRAGAYAGLAPSAAHDAGHGRATEAHQRLVARLYTRGERAAGKAEFGDPRYLLPNRIRAAGKRVAVFTAIFGDYDTLKLPYPTWAEGADFYCFTDSAFRDAGVWRLVVPDYHDADPTRLARWIKTHAHAYFPDYEASIWLDGNIAFVTRPGELLASVGEDLDVVSFHHRERRSVAEEVAECIRTARDDADVLAAQLGRYEAQGYVQRSDLMETNVMIFRHRRPAVARFLKLWWREIENGSRRDQVSVNYSIDAVPELKVGYLADVSAHDSRYVKIVKHNAS